MSGPVLLATGALAVLVLGWLLWRLHGKARRLEAERRALRDRERYIYTILDNMVHGLLLFGPDGRIVEAGAGAVRLLGRPAAELRGMPCRSLVYPPDCDIFDDLLRTVVLTPGAEVRRELRVVQANGSVRWMEIVATNLLEDPNVGGFLLQAHDLTESRRTLESRGEAAAGPAEVIDRPQGVACEERQHRLISEHAGDVVATLDPSGSITYVSPSCQALLGYSQEEFKQLFGELIHPDDVARVNEAMGRAMAAESSRVTYRVRKRDGQHLWLETVTTAVRDERRQVSGMVASSRDVTAQKRLEEQLLHMAYHDQMTALPNRIALEEHLEQALAGDRGQYVGVIYVDIDNFKVINDSLGHQAGDDILVQVAARLQDHRRGGLVARLGGDEFCAVVEGLASADEAIDATERIGAALDAPLQAGGREIQLTFSFGIAVGSPRTLPAKELLRQADVALHYAKRQGKARYVLYHPSMTANALERLELDAELRRAVRENQLQLFYQPIVSLQSCAVVGAEALIRWRHPRRGWVPPGEFIPVAEQSGYIIPLGRWVLEQACTEARTWQQRFNQDVPIPVSVNLSALQVNDPALVDEVAEVLEKTGLPPECLTLEITETALMHNPEITRPILQRLKGIGLKLAMDDFGAGHSSLHYLKQFPIDMLKIDRSFVSGLGLNRVDSALVRTVVDLAGALNMGVTAEGVESPEQVAELAGIGCEKAQGYYYAQPVPPDQLGSVLTGLRYRVATEH